MGKLGKRTRKFVRKHLKSAIEKRRKTKPMRDAFRRKQAAFNKSELGRKRNSVHNARKDADDHSQKRGSENSDLGNAEYAFIDDESSESIRSMEEMSSESDNICSEVENEYLESTCTGLTEEVSEGENEDVDNSLQQQNNYLKSQNESCKEQLDILSKEDPGFLKFMMEHEKELRNENNPDSDDDSEEIKQVQMNSKLENGDSETLQVPLKSVLAIASVDMLCQEVMEKQNIKALKFLLQSFRIACYYGNDQKQDSLSFTIVQSSVYRRIILFVLDEIDGIFRKYLKIPSPCSKKEVVLEMKKTPRWRALEGLIKSYFVSCCHLVNEMTDNEVIAFILEHMRRSIILLSAFPNEALKLLRVVINLWAAGQQPLSAASFVFMRDMIIQLDSDILKFCLKKVYKTFAVNCKHVNKANYPQIQFLKNCIMDIYGVDLVKSSQYAFDCINKLAMALQCAFKTKTKESLKIVHSWQFVNCLDLWVKFLCSFAEECDFKSLSYPLAQIIIGVVHLVHSSRYSPLRLRCISMLNKLASSGGVFIPVASFLLDILEFKEFDKVPTEKSCSFSDFLTLLKVPKSALKSQGFQNECVYSVLDLLTEHLAQWGYHVAFPDLAFPILIRLQRFHERTSIDKFQRQVKQLIDQIECNAALVSKKREETSFSPKDHDAVSAFIQVEKASGTSPIAKYYATLQSKPEFKANSLQRARTIEEDGFLSFSIQNCNAKEEDGIVMKDIPCQNINDRTGFSSMEIQSRSNTEDDGSYEASSIAEDMDLLTEEANKPKNKKRKPSKLPQTVPRQKNARKQVK
eukprot:TRINITY_DN23432_c0_g1_i1.p1 TRINITY_DN23432_c0_g1~~TRINITY_DN23432_c0_g1_i1.p1  ORF type:complete len:802 (+),score=168.31 TRINITY_DN23432_c0_g1_i1:173-2578(+)